MKTIIIIPYFGKVPNYFELWLKTIEFNKKFNWLLFLDDKRHFNYPSNVKVEYTTFKIIKEKIKSKFDFKIELNSPYKLCDYRPAYGYLFSEYLDGFDFWGYGDLDLLYGDLDKYISKDILVNYDRIYPNGHLSLYRNCDEINSAFKLEGIYKEAFSTPRAFCFDEWPGVTSIFKRNGIRQLDENFMADISWLSYKLKHTKKEFNNYKKQLFLWKDGAVFQVYLLEGVIKYEEFAYVHLQKRNMKFNNVKFSNDENKGIAIVPDSFKYLKSNLDIEMFKRLTSFSLIGFLVFIKKILYRRFNNLKKKITF